ncbi:hypothetical protein [Sediminibacillus massiliensis]|uniref:hypothetical protein n=1 Tax=Sediminibacillus massiliensis TaxID=1926277 RepID=UPI00098849AB|nr:hypothetical protein [Sediminibacillus massiliensis]
MAFGLKRDELRQWKMDVENGDIAFLTHYWIDSRFPGCDTVTKVGCSDIEKLALWGSHYGLLREWIHLDKCYPHFDLLGNRQKEILIAEEQWNQLHRFKLV